jgi:hypothetical protein
VDELYASKLLSLARCALAGGEDSPGALTIFETSLVGG